MNRDAKETKDVNFNLNLYYKQGCRKEAVLGQKADSKIKAMGHIGRGDPWGETGAMRIPQTALRSLAWA